MEGDTRIELQAPVAQARGAGGGARNVFGTPVTVWAIRRDRGGGVKAFADLRAGEWGTRFEIRTPVGAANMPEADWLAKDDSGARYHIEAVDEVPGSRRRRLWLYAVRRQ